MAIAMALCLKLSANRAAASQQAVEAAGGSERSGRCPGAAHRWPLVLVSNEVHEDRWRFGSGVVPVAASRLSLPLEQGVDG